MGQEGSRRSGLVIEAADPFGSGTWEVLISYDRLHTVARRGMGHAKECAYIVPEILQNPTAIFEGLREEKDEDQRGVGWLCYCGIPEKAYHADGTSRSPYPLQVYLVFVNDDRVAYNWRWEKADADDPQLPCNYQTRFRRRLR